ncbi:hypothetical protein ABEY53_23425, partial [Bacillus mycoides]|uniref:hypothetical protein n=1 Tax=Bacillus mycoides TaxID=1405 RepID=UPI003D1CFEF4
RKQKKTRRKTENDSKEKIHKQPPTLKKQKATSWRPPLSFPYKKFVLFHKRGFGRRRWFS